MSQPPKGPVRLNPDQLDDVTGGAPGSSFNYQQLTDAMGQNTSSTEANLASFSQTMDAGSAADMIKLQNLTQQWTLAVNLQSETMKATGDALKGIVQKVG